jgi:type I restriction enzyme M protein
VPEGAGFADMVALKGKPDIRDQINKKIVAPLAASNQQLSQADFPDFNDSVKLGDGKEKVERLTNLIAIFESPSLDFKGNCADGDDILGDAYEYLMRHFATESGTSRMNAPPDEPGLELETTCRRCPRERPAVMCPFAGERRA